MSELTDGAVALADVHAKVCEYHNLDPSQVAAPTEGVLATWNMANPNGVKVVADEKDYEAAEQEAAPLESLGLWVCPSFPTDG